MLVCLLDSAVLLYCHTAHPELRRNFWIDSGFIAQTLLFFFSSEYLTGFLSLESQRFELKRPGRLYKSDLIIQWSQQHTVRDSSLFPLSVQGFFKCSLTFSNLRSAVLTCWIHVSSSLSAIVAESILLHVTKQWQSQLILVDAFLISNLISVLSL